MAVDGRELIAVRDQYILVLSGLPGRDRNLAFDRNQVEDVLARSQLLPRSRHRRNRHRNAAVPDLARRQLQKTFVRSGEARGVGPVANAQWREAARRDPQAACAILQHHRGARFVVGDHAAHALAAGKIVYAIAILNPIHCRDGQRPRVHCGALHNADIVQAGNMEQDAGLLLLPVEPAAGYAGHCHFGVQQFFQLTRGDFVHFHVH